MAAETLLLRYRSGDPEAFAQLVAEYRAPVYSYLVRCGVPEADREDVFQEIFIRLHAGAAGFQSGLPLHPWLFTIVANAVRTYHRKRRLRELVFSSPLPAHETPEPARDEPASEPRRILAWLEKEVRKLPLAQREVLVLVCVEGLPLKHVAEALALPLNTVKTRLRRARLALAERLDRRNGGRRGEDSP